MLTRPRVALQHIQSGKPNQTTFAERLNTTYRHESLDGCVITLLAEVRQVTEDWASSITPCRAGTFTEIPHTQPANLVIHCILNGEAYAETFYLRHSGPAACPSQH